MMKEFYLKEEDSLFLEDMEIGLDCYEATLRMLEDGNGATSTILCSSSGENYQLLNVIKKSIFGLVVRGVVIRNDTNSFPSTPFSSSVKCDFDQVAIKIYAREKIDELVAQTRCKEDPVAEVSIMQSLKGKHSNVLGQIECCADSTHIYSIMPLLAGSELYDVVANKGKVEEPEARVIMHQILDGLQFLHSQGVAHRDVSLENVMYDTKKMQAVLIDFGLSVQCESRGAYVPNTFAGKMFYLAPESLQSQIQYVDPFAGDVWSAGICFLYMLLGFPPVEHAARDDIRFEYLINKRYQELLKHWSIEISDEALDLVYLLLQTNPRSRPSVEAALKHPWFNGPTSI